MYVSPERRSGYDVLVQPNVDEDGNLQPMVIDSKGRIIVDSYGYIWSSKACPQGQNCVGQKTQTAGIQEAINYAINTNQRRVFAKGLLTINQTITINGQVWFKFGKINVQSDIPAIKIVGPTSWSDWLTDVRIEGEIRYNNLSIMQARVLTSPTSSSNPAIIVENFVRDSLIDVTVNGFYVGILIPNQLQLASQTGQNNPVNMMRIRLTAYGVGAGIIASSTSDNEYYIHVENSFGANPTNFFSQVYQSTPSSLSNVPNELVGNYINDLGNSKLYIKHYTTPGGHDLLVLQDSVQMYVQGKVLSGGIDGMKIIGGSEIYVEHMIIGNTDGHGIEITDDTNAAFDISISDIHIDSVGMHGIYAHPSSSSSPGVGFVIVDRSFITNTSKSSPGTYNGIDFQGAYLRVTSSYIGNVFTSTKTMGYAINFNYSGVDYVEIEDNIFENTINPAINYITGIYTLIRNNQYNNASPITVSTPPVPSSGTAQQNIYPLPVRVYLYGGNVTEVQITKAINGTTYTVFSNSSGVSMTGQVFYLDPADQIVLTYSSAPSWVWVPA